MFGWIKKMSKGSVELAVERLEDFVTEHGPVRRAAVMTYALWTSNHIRDPSFRGIFYYGNGSMEEASVILDAVEQLRDMDAKVADHMTVVHKRLEMPASELGSYATIRVVALDLVCATIGVSLRANLEDRVRNVWEAFVSSKPSDALIEEIVKWFRSEGGLLNELGSNDPVANMTIDDIRVVSLPLLARS